MTGLETSQVYKCLEKKTLILGFEIIDLFILSILLCLLNFIFSGSSLKFFYTFGPVIAIGVGLRAMKNGKADNYLLHWLKYYVTPGIYWAYMNSSDPNLLLLIRRKGKKKCSVPL